MKVYCGGCQHYYLVGVVEDCIVIEKGGNYLSKDEFIHILPPERNKDNDCKWYKNKKEI
ncbi:hypothetical protein LCGC14_2072110 [marine sediment metagenome]|uniref:Uncharacterized protein n=1 Tax=marine sediment metagenome TaxID=412755 RepID=A0A0F9EI91_9ZZZZ